MNVTRNPALRDAILAGTLHRFVCPSCQRGGIVETAFNFIDIERRLLVRVQPRQERHRWREASAKLSRDADRMPEDVMPRKDRRLRVVFGLGELREKLVADDAGLDDHIVELLKVHVIQDHPFLAQRARLRLTLVAATGAEARFTATFDHGDESFSCVVPLTDLDLSPRKHRAWAKAAHGDASHFARAEDDHWVNMWRWSPQPAALAALEAYAADARAGKPLPTGTREFRRMLKRLPRGKNLPTTAKQPLQDLFTYARAKNDGELEDALFEIRFGVALDDDWALNRDPDDIETLWNLLRELPADNVVGNVKLDRIRLDKGDDGGAYDPSTHDIYIDRGLLRERESFEDVMRHEVGHAVHEKLLGRVDEWLREQFGWEVFDATDSGIDRWMHRMGGWGALTAQQRAEVRRYLKDAIGPGGKWAPGAAPKVPAGHIWHGHDFGPRLACERSIADWYTNHRKWYVRDGKAFCLNYWYQQFMVVDVRKGLGLLRVLPDAYAAMSPSEFFAEIYALYYDGDDEARKKLPRSVTAWLDEEIGRGNIGIPARRRAQARAR